MVIPKSINRSVYIVGCGRSGSTLLQRLLAQSFDTKPLPEFLFLDLLDRVDDFDKEKKLAAVDLLDSDYLGNVRTKRKLHRLITSSLREAVGHDSAQGSPLSVRFLDIINESIQRSSLIPIHKTLNLCMDERTIKFLGPNAVFLHIVRDGRVVADSHVRLGWYPSYDSALVNWFCRVRQTSHSLSKLDSSQVVTIRYEDLVRDPLGVTNGVLRQHLGLQGLSSIDDGIARAARNLPIPASLGAHRELFRPIDRHAGVVEERPSALAVQRLLRRYDYVSAVAFKDSIKFHWLRHSWLRARTERQTALWVALSDRVRRGSQGLAAPSSDQAHMRVAEHS